ncbi:MAG: cytochrome c peroxidase, partial [Pseudomonadota bacterium]
MPLMIAGLWLASAKAASSGTPQAVFSVITAPDPGASDGPSLEVRVRAAANKGARLVALSDDLIAGAPEALDGERVARLVRLARTHGVWLAVLVPESSSPDVNHYFRTSLLIDDHGRMVREYRQVIVDARRYGEQVTRGDFRATVESIDLEGLRIGMINGRDLLPGVARLADRGATAIVVHADWERAEPIDWWGQAARLAERFDVHLLIANATLGVPSGVVSPDGTRRIVTAEGELTLPLRARELPLQVNIPLGLPRSVPAPDYRPATAELVELGRSLFFDGNLSSDGSISCGTCHLPDQGFTNGARVGSGVQGLRTARNVPTLLNVAFRPLLRWDGYASSIENFMKYPISGHNEMNLHYLDALIDRLNASDDYVERFQRVFGNQPIEFGHVEQALAAYSRSLISGNSPFDRYWFGKEEEALDAQARKGLGLFLGRGRCVVCHQIERDHALFTDYGYHNLGIGWEADRGVYRDLGLGGISTNDFSGLFQTPILRDVAKTAPYMHDGSRKTLDAVLSHYAAPVPGLGHLEISPMRFTKSQRRA